MKEGSRQKCGNPLEYSSIHLPFVGFQAVIGSVDNSSDDYILSHFMAFLVRNIFLEWFLSFNVGYNYPI